MTVASDDTLWIGTEGGGLVRYRKGEFRAYSRDDGLTNGYVRSVYEARDKSLWVGTDDGLFLMDGGVFQRIDGRNGVPVITVHSIAEDMDGHLWIGGSQLVEIAKSTARVHRLSGASAQDSVKTIHAASDGTVWAGTVSGLYQKRPSSELSRVPGIEHTVRVLREGSDGVHLIGTIGGGVRLL